jgi:hypothetical protein
MIVSFFPCACDFPRSEPHEEIERARHLLALTPEEESASRRVADAFLAGLRERKIAVVDMRPSFAAEPEPPYWKTDLHLDLRGHRLVADALAPAVLAALR